MSDLGYLDELNAIGEANASSNGHSEEPVSMVDKLAGAILTTAAIRAIPPPEWLIDGYLTRNSLALLYGPSGTYKTFLGMDLALHLATGSWWNRHEIARPGRVLYVLAEGVAGAGARIDAWLRHHGIYDLDRHQPIAWLPRAVNLSDRLEVAALTQVVPAHEPDLIIIDTLARCSVGAEENSAKDMGQVVEHLDTIRRATGACVLCIHHSGKDASGGARGSSALRAAMDTELEMSEGDPLVLKVTKQKDAAEEPDLHLTPLTIGGSCVLLPSRQVAQGSEIGAGAMATLDALRAVMVPGGISTGVWFKASMKPERSFYRHRAQLEGAGFVKNVGTETVPRYVVAGGEGGDSTSEGSDGDDF